MTKCRKLFCLTTLAIGILLASSPLHAERPVESLLQSLPAEGHMSISLRNVDRLDRELQKLDRRGWNFPFKSIIQLMIFPVGIRQGIDWEGMFSACLMDGGRQSLGEEALKNVVFCIPFNDAKLMAGNFGLTAEEFAEGKIHFFEKKFHNNLNIHITRQQQSLLLCVTKESLESCLKSPSLKSVVSTDPEQRLSQADILFHIDVNHFRPDQFDRQMESALAKMTLGQTETVKQRAREIIQHIDRGYLALTVDNAFHVRMQMSLDQKLSKPAQQILKDWGTVDEAPTLRGFPAGKMLFAMSKTAGEIRNSKLLQQILLWIVSQSSRHQITEMIQPYLVPREDTFYGVIDELWNSIVEARSVLYQNETPTVDGLVILLVILKPHAPNRFSKQLAELIKFSKGTVYKPNRKVPEQITIKQIEALILQLGANDFDDRAAATLRLKLLGERALPLLQESIDSPDPEIAGRSKRIVAAIRKTVDQQTDGVLKEGLAALPLPEFIIYENQRQVAGYSTDLLQVVWKEDAKVNNDRLRELVGPLGDEILLVHVEDEIVLFWGSNRELLRESLRLLKHQDQGLEKGRTFFAERASHQRLIEVHASIQRIIKLTPNQTRNNRAGEEMQITDDYSSFGIEVAPTHFIGDATFPISEYLLLSRYLFH